MSIEGLLMYISLFLSESSLFSGLAFMSDFCFFVGILEHGISRCRGCNGHRFFCGFRSCRRIRCSCRQLGMFRIFKLAFVGERRRNCC
jgi:hypothetical protein